MGRGIGNGARLLASYEQRRFTGRREGSDLPDFPFAFLKV